MAKRGTMRGGLHPLVIRMHIEETTRRATRRTRRHHFTVIDLAALLAAGVLLVLAFAP